MNDFASLVDSRKILGSKNLKALILKAQTIAAEFRSKETELINVLIELDSSKAYRLSGYNSLFTFCVEVLQLTEHQAYQYITVSRKCTEVPELMVALEDRRITVSKARKMTSVITSQNQREWIDLAHKSSQKDLEKAVRAQDPLPPVRDHLQILSTKDVKLQATLNMEVYEKLKRALELMDENKGSNVSINEALDLFCESYLNKNDPVARAKQILEKRNARKSIGVLGAERENVISDEHRELSRRVNEAASPKDNSASVDIQYLDGTGFDQETRRANSVFAESASRKEFVSPLENLSGPRSASSGLNESFVENNEMTSAYATTSTPVPGETLKRSALAAKVRHQVYLRDQGQCRFHRHGKRCGSRKYLEIHHRTPLSLGGSDDVTNLVLLCSSHHKFVHRFRS